MVSLAVLVCFLAVLHGVSSQLATLDGIFKVSSASTSGHEGKSSSTFLWTCQESSSGNVMCAGATKPNLSAEDEQLYGFCERNRELSSSEEGRRRLKGHYGKHGKHFGKYGKHGKHFGKYGKYWHTPEAEMEEMSPYDAYESRSPSELYRSYYDSWYGEGAYDRDFPLDDQDTYPPVDGEFSMPEFSAPEFSAPEFSVPIDPPFSIPDFGPEPPIKFKPEPPIKFKPDPKFPPGKDKFPPKKGKPFMEEGRRALTETQPTLLRVVEPAPELDLTIINIEGGVAGAPSFSFGHQMTNGSYRILHSDIKSDGDSIPSGYYTIVPNRTPSGDFKKATCYGAPVSSGVGGDRMAVATFDMVRLNI